MSPKFIQLRERMIFPASDNLPEKLPEGPVFPLYQDALLRRPIMKVLH
jgi:hypothetical protein